MSSLKKGRPGGVQGGSQLKYELVSSGGMNRKIGEGGMQHTIPVQGSCCEHAEAVKLLSSYA